MTSITLDEKAAIQTTAIATELQMPEHDVVHLAIQRLSNEMFVDQEPDNGPLSSNYLIWLQDKANKEMNGKPEFNKVLIT